MQHQISSGKAVIYVQDHLESHRQVRCPRCSLNYLNSHIQVGISDSCQFFAHFSFLIRVNILIFQEWNIWIWLWLPNFQPGKVCQIHREVKCFVHFFFHVWTILMFLRFHVDVMVGRYPTVERKYDFKPETSKLDCFSFMTEDARDNSSLQR